jgi:hypothetical protein
MNLPVNSWVGSTGIEITDVVDGGIPPMEALQKEAKGSKITGTVTIVPDRIFKGTARPGSKIRLKSSLKGPQSCGTLIKYSLLTFE